MENNMMNNEFQEKVQAVFRKVFEDENLVITPETSMDDIPAWDSLHNVMLIDALENEFNIKFGLDDMLEMNDVSAIVDKIKEKTA